MKKINFIAVFGILVANVFASCSSEDLMSETLTAEKTENIISLEAPVETKVSSTEGQGSVRRWTLSDGQTVTARHSGNIDVNSIEIVNIDEVPVDDNTVNVNVTVASRSAANTITKSVSYAKVVKEEAAPAEPTIIHEYFAADTTMVYKTYESGTVKVSMQHKLYQITEWSDARQDSTQIWDKTIKVAKTFLGTSVGRAYSRTEAKNFQHSSSLVWYESAEEQDESFTIQTRKGEFVFVVDYINDANYPMKSDHHVVAEESTVKCSYNGYEAVYDFRWSANFAGQEEVDKNLEDETRGNYTYQYEANSIGSWKISLSGAEVGVRKVDIDVLRYFE